MAVCVIGSWAAASPAHASGFAAANFGGDHGNVVTTNPTALYFNPAGIAFAEGTNLYAGGVLALRRGSWTHAQARSEMAEPPGANGADAGQARFSNLFGAPVLAASTTTQNLALGAAFYVPFGGRLHWDENPRFANDAMFSQAIDGVQRWHLIEGQISSLYFTAGAAVRWGRLAIGVTGNLIQSSLRYTQAQTTNPQAAVDPTSEARAVIDVSGWQASFGVGAMLEAVADRLWIGASYQAQPGLGSMKLDGTLTLSVGSATAPPTPITLTQGLPEILRLGVRIRPLNGTHALELRAYGDWTRWSRMQSQCLSNQGAACAVSPDGTDATPASTTIQDIPRRWTDTYGVYLGASYWILPNVELFSGIGFETAAVPDETLDPMLPDADAFRISLGGRFALPAKFHVTAGLTDVQYMSRNNSGRSTLSDVQLPGRRPDGGGQYAMWLGLIHIGVEKQF